MIVLITNYYLKNVSMLELKVGIEDDLIRLYLTNRLQVVKINDD